MGNTFCNINPIERGSLMKGLTLITSESCNLQCEYCAMAAHAAATAHAPIVKELREAIANGTFLQNVKKALDRWGTPYSNIETVSFWGQEPTLTLDLMEQQWPDIIKTFPNINDLFFSSNIASYPERIISFVKTVNDNLVNDKPFSFGIQVSYDGEYGTRFSRGIEPQVLLDNLRIIIKGVNELKLKDNFTIQFNSHPVVSLDTISLVLKSKEEFDKYWNEFFDLEDEINSYITNERLKHFHVCPGFINPYNATVEEGLKVEKFFALCEANVDMFIKHADKLKENGPMFESLYSQLTRAVSHFSNNETIEDKIDGLILNPVAEPAKAQHLGCSVHLGELKLRYDGSALHCQNEIFGLRHEDLNSFKGETWASIQEAMMDEKSTHPNLVTDTDEVLDKFKYRWDSANISSLFSNLYAITVNLMVLLAEAGQIHPSYSIDQDKLLRHAYFITTSSICWDAAINNTGSYFGRISGWIRLLANGACDHMEKFYKMDAERRKALRTSKESKYANK